MYPSAEIMKPEPRLVTSRSGVWKSQPNSGNREEKGDCRPGMIVVVEILTTAGLTWLATIAKAVLSWRAAIIACSRLILCPQLVANSDIMSITANSTDL